MSIAETALWDRDAQKQGNAGNEKQIKEEIAVIFDKTCYDLNFTPLFIGKILSNVYSNWDMEKYHKEVRKNLESEEGKKIMMQRSI